MKLSLILLLYPACLFSQTTLDAKRVSIDFDRALHFVCSNTVEYISAGSDCIEAKIVDESKNIVSVIAMEEEFVGFTNVVIVTKSGEVHTYSITYKSDVNEPSVFFPDDEGLSEKKLSILVNKKNVGHLIFDNNISYFKQGNETAFKVTSTTAKNILQVKENDDADMRSSSNLFCVDTNGQCFYVKISEGNNLSYVYNASSNENIKAKVRQNEETIESICKQTLLSKRNIMNEGIKKNKLEFSVNNLFINKDLFYFVFEVKNNSNIDIDFDFVKCFFVDEKQFKDAVQQEMVVEYRQQYNFEDKVKAGESRKFVLVFDKFTIPDKKIFKVEIYEKDGGRHINFRMRNDLIIGAKAI